MADKHNLLTRNHLSVSGKVVISTLIFHIKMLWTSVFLLRIFLFPHMSVQVLSVSGGSPGQVGWTRVSPQISGGCWSFSLLCWGLTTSLSHQERKYRDQQHARGNSSFPCPFQSTGSVAPLETFHRRAEHHQQWRAAACHSCRCSSV